MGGTFEAPAVAATVAAPGLDVGGLTGVEVSSTVAYAPDAVTVEALLLRWREARIEAQGTIGLRGRQPLDLTFAADAVDVPSVLAALEVGDVPVRGTFAARGGVSGTVARPSAAVTVRGDALEAYAEHLGALSGRVDLTDREIRVDALRLVKPQPDGDGELTLSGTYRLDTEAYTIAVASKDLRVLTAMLPDGRAIRGQVAVSGSGQGTIADPGADVELTAEALQVADADLGRVAVHATVAAQRATVTATADRFAVDGHGVIGVRAPYPAVITVRADGLDLTALPLALNTPLDGVVRASAEVAGDLATPARLAATATIASFAGRGTASRSRSRRPVPALRERAPRHRAAAADGGRFVGRRSAASCRSPIAPAAGAIAVEAHGDLATLAQYAAADFPITGDGAVTVTGTLRGTLSAIDPDLTIAVDNGLVLPPPSSRGCPTSSCGPASPTAPRTSSTLTATWGTARLDASGRVPLEVLPALPVEIPRREGRRRSRRRSPASTRRRFPARRPACRAASASTPRPRPRAPISRARGPDHLPRSAGRLQRSDARAAAAVGVGIAGGVATIEPTHAVRHRRHAAASGTVGLTGERPLDRRRRGHGQRGRRCA